MIFQDQVKHAIDVASIGTVVATLTEWLPPIAALISIIWGLIRIYETRTIQALFNKCTRK